MNVIVPRAIAAGLFFLAIFVTGFWLSRLGRPYSGLLFSLHKLIALAALVFLGVMLVRAQRPNPLDALQLAAIVVSGLCFIVTILTGGLGSLEGDTALLLQRIHQFMPYATVLSSAPVGIEYVWDG